MGVLKRLVDTFRPLLFLVYLSTCGVLSVVGAMSYMHIKPDIIVYILCLSIIFFVYLLNYHSDTTEDAVNDAERVLFFHKRTIILMLGIALLIGVFALCLATRKFSAYYLLIIAIGCEYTSKLLPWYSRKKGVHFFRFKDIPVVKNVVVASLWGISIFVVPILAVKPHGINYPIIALLIGAMILSTFMNTIFDDIRDEVGDRMANTKTVPTLFGATVTYAIMGAMTLGWLVLVGALWKTGLFDSRHLLFFIVLAVYPLIYIVPHIFKKFSRSAIDFLCESDLLIFSTGMLVLTLVR